MLLADVIWNFILDRKQKIYINPMNVDNELSEAEDKDCYRKYAYQHESLERNWLPRNPLRIEPKWKRLMIEQCII